MQDGFLGYRTSFMLDLVACALVIIVPVLLTSLYLVRFRKQYQVHKYMQVALGIVLLVAVGLFEVDMRLQGGIQGILAKRVTPLTAAQSGFFRQLLIVHLVFAISTVGLWGTTLILALRRMPCPPGPSPHSSLHKLLGWLSAIDITATAVTGLMVYYFGFMV